MLAMTDNDREIDALRYWRDCWMVHRMLEELRWATRAEDGPEPFLTRTTGLVAGEVSQRLHVLKAKTPCLIFECRFSYFLFYIY